MRQIANLALNSLTGEFQKPYSPRGRMWSRRSGLICALRLQALYSLRSERRWSSGSKRICCSARLSAPYQECGRVMQRVHQGPRLAAGQDTSRSRHRYSQTRRWQPRRVRRTRLGGDGSGTARSGPKWRTGFSPQALEQRDASFDHRPDSRSRSWRSREGEPPRLDRGAVTIRAWGRCRAAAGAGPDRSTK
jgi:hypothetical protein